MSLLIPFGERHLVKPSPVDPNLLMDLPVPNWITPKRVLYYGFEITESWLLKYTETHWNEYFPDSDIEEFDDMDRVFYAVGMIQEASGFSRATLRSALPSDGTIVENTFVLDTKPERIVAVLYLCSTLKRSYQKRPTKEQYNLLVEIVGKEAEWWIQHK